MASNIEKTDRRETGRLEAFSDGVFAFAITLLVLYLKDPTANGGGSLLQGLLNQWPTFFAFVTSFMTILIMWIGHHEMFRYIHRIDQKFMFLNGFLLFFVTLTPFTTSLVADHVLSGVSRDSQTAAAVYAGSFFSLSLIWGFLLRHASGQRRLLAVGVSDAEILGMTRSAYIGLACYAAALLIAFFSGLASVALILAVAVYYAVGPNAQRRSSAPTAR